MRINIIQVYVYGMCTYIYIYNLSVKQETCRAFFQWKKRLKISEQDCLLTTYLEDPGVIPNSGQPTW